MVNETEISGKLLEAQAALIGALLIKPEIAGALFGAVPAEDFTIPAYRHLYDESRKLFRDGQPIDAVILAGRAGKDYKQTIIDCVSTTATAANWKAYAEQLREEATAYRLRGMGMQLVNCKNAAEGESIVREAAALFDRRQTQKSVSLAEALDGFLARQRQREKPQYLKTGLPKLDNGSYIERGDYIVLGGYPSAGKSALAIQFALSLAAAGRVGFFSLETKIEKLADRAAACYCNLYFADIKNRTLSEGGIRKVEGFRSMMGDRLPIYFLEAAGMTVDELTATALNMRLDVVIVDYLQLLQTGRQAKSRYEATTEISMALHQFSQRHGVTVIALSQLTRPDRTKDGNAPRPTMRDLRESGQIEQDADLILLLYPPTTKANAPERVLAIAKNKEGQRGSIYLTFQGDRQRFYQENNPPKPKGITMELLEGQEAIPPEEFMR